MHVAADAVALAAHDHGDLGVGLEADEPVDDVDALFLEGAGPLDVALFVKARFELYQHRHLLAVAGRFQQSGHGRRIAAHAVEGHLDREHVGVASGSLEPIDHRFGE